MMSSLKSFLKPERPDPPVATKFPSVRPNAKPLPTNAPSSFVQQEPGTFYHLHYDLLALILGNLKLIYKITT